jgi:nucleoside-diphosphate-sugar epimerase
MLSLMPQSSRSWNAAKFIADNRLHRLFSRLRKTQIIRIAADLFLINLALIISFLLRYLYATTYGDVNLTPDPTLTTFCSAYLRLAPWASVVAVGVFISSGFYGYGRTYQTKYKILIVAEAVTIAFLLIGALAFVAPSIIALPRSVLFLGWGISLLMFISSRIWTAVWRYIVRTEENGSQRVTSVASDKTVPETVLLIGGAGYIGSALLPKLVAEGYRVRVLDLLLYGTDPIERYLDHPQVEIARSDFRRVDAVVSAMRGVKRVVHLGGIVGDPACAIDEELTIDVNLTATRMIGEVAKGQGIKRFIFASTCSVYGASSEVLDENSSLTPLSLYARSKVGSEKVLLDMADGTFTPVIARFATIYGLSGRTRFDLVVNLLAAKAIFEGAITVCGGTQWRPFLHVDDAAAAVLHLLRLPACGAPEIFNIGSSDENYTIEQMADIIKEYVPEAKLIRIDNEQDRRDYRVSFSKIERVAGFKPKWTVAKGVQQVVDAIRAGRVIDYRDFRYSNERFLHEMRTVALAAPNMRWAHELVGQARRREALEGRTVGGGG